MKAGRANRHFSLMGKWVKCWFVGQMESQTNSAQLALGIRLIGAILRNNLSHVGVWLEAIARNKTNLATLSKAEKSLAIVLTICLYPNNYENPFIGISSSFKLQSSSSSNPPHEKGKDHHPC